MNISKNPYTERRGYIWAASGENGWFCVFDRSKRDKNWSAGTHQWSVMKMPNGPEKTTRTRYEAVKLATASAHITDSLHQWLEMTHDQSRLLERGDRVCWAGSKTDLGTVTRNRLNGVTIKWDDGRTGTNSPQRYG
jgi:hypothetical protein